MPRPPRLQIPGATVHVTGRGVERRRIFLDDADYSLFVSLLRHVARRHRWRCHAYCLMPNHYHLLLETPFPNLSAGMQRLNGTYARAFNDRHVRVGHLFQGRFYSEPIEDELHFLELGGYIALNPVRAGLCETAAAWRWRGGALDPPS